MALSNLKYGMHRSGESTLEGKDVVKGARGSRFACVEFECSPRKLIVYHANCERIPPAGKHSDNIFDFARAPRAIDCARRVGRR